MACGMAVEVDSTRLATSVKDQMPDWAVPASGLAMWNLWKQVCWTVAIWVPGNKITGFLGVAKQGPAALMWGTVQKEAAAMFPGQAFKQTRPGFVLIPGAEAINSVLQ